MADSEVLTTLKILIIGESGVGKSRFVVYFLSNELEFSCSVND